MNTKLERPPLANPERGLRPNTASLWLRIIRNWQLYVLLLPLLLHFAVFQYAPMYGLQIAFKDFRAADGIWGSAWAGFEHFERFFQSYQFWNTLKNTMLLNLYDLIFGFPIAVIFALMLNQVTQLRFKKWVQTVTYAPHFISTVVLVGMLFIFLNPRTGMANNIIAFFGGERINFFGEAGWFKSVYIISEIWQTMGWSAIIYLAALTAVDPQLHEAAIMDGANKFQRVRHIDVPTIMPVIMIMLILKMGHFASIGFAKVLLMQNSLNIDSSEVIQTYVYKTGLVGAQYSYSAAIGLFDNLINFTLLILTNQLAKKMKQQSLF
ncbi:ABC transporter permease [Paenibacillus nasutitermitis]|uniref:Sugar ABC transporter permease n=1 Tax=Paenibacillus nasutitermitis TaxID=1652958 RepID=A0A916ZFJ0_9BACL|nr:ABC transporter permease subunit [Paenibacillus nasutitermitis]GGD94164.1 sugar ABC transporter permease [Paenibacillus nasutitermitis]